MVPVLLFVLLVAVVGLPDTINIGEFNFMCLLAITNLSSSVATLCAARFNIQKFCVLCPRLAFKNSMFFAQV
jgi:hypothetical protein